MNAFEVIAIVSCVTSVVTMIAICITAMPHLKSAMVAVRDTVLWIVFVVVLCGLMFIGFHRLIGQDPSGSEAAQAEPAGVVNEHYAGR